MSSSGSVGISVELPAATLADRLAALVAIGAAGVLPLALVPDPAVSAVLGVALALLTAVVQRSPRRPARDQVRQAELGLDGVWSLVLADGRSVRGRTGPGTRILGRSLVLDLRGQRGTGRLWLTPADVPADSLRRLTVRLLAAGRRTNS